MGEANKKAVQYEIGIALLHQRSYVVVAGENFRPTREFLTDYRRAVNYAGQQYRRALHRGERPNSGPRDIGLKETILQKGPATDDQLECMLYVMRLLIQITERQLGRRLV